MVGEHHPLCRLLGWMHGMGIL